MTLQEMMEYFFHLYGPRNRIFLPALDKRINFFNLALSDLQEAVRKGVKIQHVEIALARLVARIFCIAEHFWQLPLIEMVARKYPMDQCSYCQSLPCKCIERRHDAQLAATASKEQNSWSLQKWGNHLNVIYGERNKEKGIENLLNRLFREVSELLSLEMKIPGMKISPAEIEKEFALELADTLAWIIAIANFYNVDLEKATLDRFGKGCWKCKKIPCQCTIFSFEPVKWLIS